MNIYALISIKKLMNILCIAVNASRRKCNSTKNMVLCDLMLYDGKATFYFVIPIQCNWRARTIYVDMCILSVLIHPTCRKLYFHCINVLYINVYKYIMSL